MTIKEFMEKDTKKNTKKILIAGTVLSPVLLPISYILDKSIILTSSGTLIVKQSAIALSFVFLKSVVAITIAGIFIGIMSLNTYKSLKNTILEREGV